MWKCQSMFAAVEIFFPHHLFFTLTERAKREREREREVEGESVWLIIDKLDITGKVKFNYNYLRQLLQREK